MWPVCYIPVILPYILKTVRWMNVILLILSPCYTKIDPIYKVYVDYIFLASDFAFHLEHAVMNDHHTLDIGSML